MKSSLKFRQTQKNAEKTIVNIDEKTLETIPFMMSCKLKFRLFILC